MEWVTTEPEMGRVDFGAEITVYLKISKKSKKMTDFFEALLIGF
jgi:hypothetical protein